MPVNYFKNAKSLRPLLFVIVLLAVIILLKFSGVADKLSDVREWINGLGFWGPLVFVLISGTPRISDNDCRGHSFRFSLGSSAGKYRFHNRSKHLFSDIPLFGPGLHFTQIRAKREIPQTGSHGRRTWSNSCRNNTPHTHFPF
jgi:hypothetical protein